MKFVDMKNNEEMIKVVITGEKTSIRVPYCNDPYEGGKPTIITANKRNVFTFFATNPYLKEYVIPVHVIRCLGPPNTKSKFEEEHDWVDDI
jgi:hypothetical protein